MATRTNDSSRNDKKIIKQVQQLDQTFSELMKNDSNVINGTGKNDELDSVVNQYSDLVTRDSYSYAKQKSITQNSYEYLANVLVGRPLTSAEEKDPKKVKEINNANKLKMEKMFTNSDMQMVNYALNQSSDMYHIIDEIESICAYMYQLDEAINVLRDNVLNNEQNILDLPFEVTFEGVDADKAASYVKTVTETWNSLGMVGKLSDHIVPLSLKYGKYYVLTIPYSEIGVKMLDKDVNRSQSLFNFGGLGYADLSVGEAFDPANYDEPIDESVQVINEALDKVLEFVYEDDENKLAELGDKNTIKHNIMYNLQNITISEAATPPNVTGVSESIFSNLDPNVKEDVERAIKRSNPLYNKYKTRKKKENERFVDATIDPDKMDDIPGCFVKLCDPREIMPIKIFDHVIGYYFFENYDFSRGHTTITDIMSNRMNFNDQNMAVDNLVGTILKKLKYGDVLKSDNNFKSMILNCILYAERRNNPIRIKFVPVEYVTEFKVNCDPDGNGQPILLKSLIFARLYISMLMFTITSIVTKSTDTEFYYIKEGALTSTYQDQVADIIEAMRNSNIDISSIINGNLLHGNRAINKRYFMSTGTQDIKPFDVEVVSGQQIDTHTDFLNDLKKMAIGSTGVPSVAIDYMDEVEYATILKMTNLKTLSRANAIQTSLNGSVDDGITGLTIKLVSYNSPNAIPEEDLVKCRCILRKNNTINNNVSADEINNNIATVDNMIETWYKGQNTENPQMIEFQKEEMRKRMIMTMSPSLPWGELKRIEDEVKIAAKIRYEKNKLMTKQQESEDSSNE